LSAISGNYFPVPFSQRTFRKKGTICHSAIQKKRIRFQIPTNDCCADCTFSKSLRSASVLRRMPDKNRSDMVFPRSATPLSCNAVASFRAVGTRLIPSSSHHFISVSRRADRDIFTPGSNAHSVARNNPTVSLTVRRFVVACETFFGCTSRFPFV